MLLGLPHLSQVEASVGGVGEVKEQPIATAFLSEHLENRLVHSQVGLDRRGEVQRVSVHCQPPSRSFDGRAAAGRLSRSWMADSADVALFRGPSGGAGLSERVIRDSRGQSPASRYPPTVSTELRV